MRIIEPKMLDLCFKAARGLAFNEAAYALRPNRFLVEPIREIDQDYVPLEPGEETNVLVQLPENIPTNANIKRIIGQFHVEDVTGLEPQQTRVDVDGPEGEKTYNLGVETPTRPRNIELRLEQGDIFWTFTGILTKKSYDLPDFAEQVNAYLDKAETKGDRITLRFLIKSDTYGKVKITIDDEEIKYFLLQTQIWENPLDDTFRVDRNFQLDFGTLKEVPLEPISDQTDKKTSFKRIEMDVGGEFGRERLLGSVEGHDGTEFATISSDYSLAQKIKLKTAIECIGMCGFFQVGEETELYIEVQNDANGFPASGSPLAKANLILIPTDENRSNNCFFADFETSVDLKKEAFYWIVFKGIKGNAKLGLQAHQEEYLQKNVLVHRGGQLWKPISHINDMAFATLIRLAYLPEIDNQTAAVEIGIKDTDLIERFDPGTEAQTLSFDVEEIDMKQTVIVIKSHARGMLNVGNVIQEYSV